MIMRKIRQNELISFYKLNFLIDKKGKNGILLVGGDGDGNMDMDGYLHRGNGCHTSCDFRDSK